MRALIKGIEMPNSCIECPCCRHDNWNGETAHQCNVSLTTFMAEDENWIYNSRPNWCPITELPSANVPQWIPVTDRLPDRNMKCLITAKNSLPKYMQYEKEYVAIDYWVQREEQMSMFETPEQGHFRNHRTKDVTAWMPLPELYKRDYEEVNG